MKPIIAMLSTLWLAMCATANQSTKPMEEFAGKAVVVTQAMYLYDADPHQYEVVPLVASTRKDKSDPGKPTRFLHFREELAVGTELRIVEVRKKRQGVENRWLLFIGEAMGANRQPGQQFEYRVLMPEDGMPKLPFVLRNG